jgi:hypothetical protein
MEEQPARGLEAKVAEQLGPLERDFDEVTNLSDLVI